MFLYSDKSGLGRSSQQNASEEGSETLSLCDNTLREVSPFSYVNRWGFVMEVHF